MVWSLQGKAKLSGIMTNNLKIKQGSVGSVSQCGCSPLLHFPGFYTDLFIYEAQGIFLTGILQGYGRFSFPQ